MSRLPRDDEHLGRESFAAEVFARDGHRCVFCGEDAIDAHHIFERKLFEDGGYYLGNGASVCEEHHMACEMTEIDVESVRAAAGISSAVLPPSLKPGLVYDKWGNIVNEDGSRERGPLFEDPGCQKALKAGGKMHLFEEWYKLSLQSVYKC